MKSDKILTVICICSYISLNLGQVAQPQCPSAGLSFGLDWLPDADNETLVNDTDTVTFANTYILPDSGLVPCDGVIKSWSFKVDTCADVWFQVWDVTSTLVGQNFMSEAVCDSLGEGDVTLGIPSHERIPIKQDYYIGFSFSTAASGLPIQVAEYPDYLTMAGDCGLNDPPIFPQQCLPWDVSNYTFLLQATAIEGPPPTINNLDSTINITENGATGVVDVYTVKSSHSSNTIPPTVSVPQAVKLIYTSAFTSPWNATDNTDGTLTVSTVVPLDYEVTPMYELPVTVTALSLTATATLTVSVINVNDIHTLDNLPRTVNVDVTDDCQVNKIMQVKVTDQDDLSQGTNKTYTIEQTTPSSPPAPFSIDPSTGEVLCTAALASWTTTNPQQYVLPVVVYDDMYHVSGNLTININGAYAKPFFKNLPHTKPVREDTADGSTIVMVEGDGPDISSIIYVINDVIPRTFYFHFGIDPANGEVTLLNELDYSIGSTVNIEIGIEDSVQSGDPKNLTLDIIWINELPVFHVTEYHVRIPEECNYMCNETDPATAWPIPNLYIDVTDSDVLQGIPVTLPDKLFCEVMSGPGDVYFAYGPAGSCTKLFVQKRLDIDDDPLNRNIILTVRVQDREGRNTTNYGVKATINITVYDLNDNAPVFDATRYQELLEENVPSGVSVLTVRATDKDPGLNGEVRYSLGDAGSPPGTEYFEVDHVTGVVTTKQPVDYDAGIRNITFRVVAKDRGIPTRESTVFVEITIIDLNDVGPAWGYGNPRSVCYTGKPIYDVIVDDPCFKNLEARDDHHVGYDVIKLKARDDDTRNSLMTFYTLYPDPYFALNEDTAHISTAAELKTYAKSILVCYAQDNQIINKISKPPLVARIDTYDPQRQLINIVMGIPLGRYHAEKFIKDLYAVLTPWFPKLENRQSDNVTVTLYALMDDTTYDQMNLDQPKHFVDRDQLLSVLRKNFKGTPADVLTGPDFERYDPILVEPTYPIWILDTIPGLVTLALICLAFVGLVVGLTVGLCYRYKKCCFRQKPQPKFEEPPPRVDKKQDPPAENPYDKVERKESPLPRRRSQQAQGRRMSTDTIHSLIYDPGLNFA